MPRPKHHIFICMTKRPDGHPRGSCGEKGSEAVYNAFSQQLIERNMQDVLLTQTGCLGPCQGGANVLIYPEGTMYGWVEVDDVKKIIDSHIVGGEIYADKCLPAEIW